MAFAPVQTGTQATTTTTTRIITLSATGVGNLVTGYAKANGNTVTLTGVTDDVGNTYVVSAAVDSGTTNRLFMAYGVQVTGGATAITFTFSNSGSVAVRCGADEFSGNNSTNATTFDVSSSGSGNSSTPSVTTFTPAANGELIYAVAGHQLGTGATWTAGTGYTLYGGPNPGSTHSEYRLSGTTSETAPFTMNNSNLWTEWAMAFIGPATNIKTVNGLAKASVKTVNGVAIASVKTINSVS